MKTIPCPSCGGMQFNVGFESRASGNRLIITCAMCARQIPFAVGVKA